MVAECSLPTPRTDDGWEPNHAAPHATCSCGIYAWYRPGDLADDGDVFGVIEATGRVLLGTSGFRAERARIVALCVPDDGDGIATRLAARYGVPAFTAPADLLDAFPPEDVTALLGREPEEPPERTIVLGHGGAGGVVVFVGGVSINAARLMDSRAAAREFEQRMRDVAALMASTGSAFRDIAVAMCELGISRRQDVPSTEAERRQRALDAVRSRGTGPKPRRFADGARR